MTHLFIAVLGAWLTVYGLGAFIAMDFNPANWSGAGRAFFVAAGFVWSCITIGFVWER